MSFPAFKILSAPVLRGNILEADGTDWPSGEDPPELIGEPRIPVAKSKLLLRVWGPTSGEAAAYMRFFFWDANKYSSEPGDGEDFLLYGEHDIDGEWDKVTPFYIGYGLSIGIPADVDFGTATPDTYTWTLRSWYGLPRDWTEVDLETDHSTGPLLLFSGFARTGRTQTTESGRELRLGAPEGILLTADEEVVKATLRGKIGLAETLRRPLAVLPEFDETTRISVPFTRGTFPDVGPPPLSRSTDGYPLTRYLPGAAESARSNHIVVDRLDCRRTPRSTLLEAPGDNLFDVSSPGYPNDGSDAWSLPGGSGNLIYETDAFEALYRPEEGPVGTIVWRKGSDASKVTKTFSGLTAGETYAFSVYVRGKTAIDASRARLSLTNVISVEGDDNFALTSTWERRTVWGELGEGTSIEVSIDLDTEGEVIEFGGWQMELSSDKGGGGEASSLIPKYQGSETRERNGLKFQTPLYADAGTIVVVLRNVRLGGEYVFVPLVTAFDPTGSDHTVLFAYKSVGTLADGIGFFIPATPYGYTSEGLTFGDRGVLLHLAYTWEPEVDAGETKTRVRLYVNGSAQPTPGLTDSFSDLMGDEIHIAPSEDLPATFGSIDTVPFSGPLELVRYDARTWSADEIANHYSLWTDDVGRDLLYLTQGRHFEMRTRYAQIPGSESYSFVRLGFSQVGEIPPVDEPIVGEFYEYAAS